MRIQSAILCEAVHILGNKLYVLGGALATWTMPLPGGFPAVVAMVIETEPDLGTDGEVEAKVVTASGDVIAEAKLEIGVADPGAPGAPWIAPLWLTLPGEVHEPGRVEVLLSIGGTIEQRLPITILAAP